MNRRHEFEIRYGISQGSLADAAAILYDGFEATLRPILGSRDRAVRLIKDVLGLGSCVAALRRGTLVGICGLRHRGQGFLRLRPWPFLRHYGPLGASKFLASLTLKRPVPKDQLMIDVIAVRPDMRGHGIGTQLLRAAHDYARSNGLHALRLEVVDTNPRAQALYERVGFCPIKTSRYPFLRRPFGFSAVITMVQPVETPLR